MAPIHPPTSPVDTSMPDAPTSQPSARLKRNTNSQPHVLYQSTFRRSQWTYLHLRLTSTSLHSSTPTPDLDPLAISHLFTQPLQAYLGTTGAAIPIDILKTAGRDVWIRIPRADARGVRAGISGWSGSLGGEKVAWRVIGEGMVGGLGEGDGGDLFGG